MRAKRIALFIAAPVIALLAVAGVGYMLWPSSPKGTEGLGSAPSTSVMGERPPTTTSVPPVTPRPKRTTEPTVESASTRRTGLTSTSRPPTSTRMPLPTVVVALDCTAQITEMNDQHEDTDSSLDDLASPLWNELSGEFVFGGSAPYGPNGESVLERWLRFDCVEVHLVDNALAIVKLLASNQLECDAAGFSNLRTLLDAFEQVQLKQLQGKLPRGTSVVDVDIDGTTRQITCQWW
jgi:hypothetical protein